MAQRSLQAADGGRGVVLQLVADLESNAQLRIEPGPSGANARCQHKRREGNAFRAASEAQLHTHTSAILCIRTYSIRRPQQVACIWSTSLLSHLEGHQMHDFGKRFFCHILHPRPRLWKLWQTNAACSLTGTLVDWTLFSAVEPRPQRIETRLRTSSAETARHR